MTAGQTETTIQQTLKQHGYSFTTARKTVFGALQYREPQTIHELVLACKGLVDRASIYRTVSLFESLGIVQRLYIGWKYKLELTDSFTHHHHHLSCINCGKVINLPEDTMVERQLRSVANSYGFVPRDHQVEIRGLCANCQVQQN